jgi:hypothetical protein
MNGGRWKKGQSGNPGGRPKAVVEIRDLARLYTNTAVKALVEVCARGKSESARVAAAQALLDRGWGKPQQDMNLNGAGVTLLQLVHASMAIADAAAPDRVLETAPPAS